MKVQSAGIGQPGHAHTAQGGVRAQSGADPNVQIPLCVYKSSASDSPFNAKSETPECIQCAQYISVHRLVFVFNALYIAHLLFSS